MKDSEEYKEILDKVPSYKQAKIFENQISNGRKIFRLFLWLNELSEIHEIVHSTKLTIGLKIWKTISSICSFIYYFADNVVWLSKIGFLSKFLPFSKRFGYFIEWSKIKDHFSLAKTLLELFIYIYSKLEKTRKN